MKVLVTLLWAWSYLRLNPHNGSWGKFVYRVHKDTYTYMYIQYIETVQPFMYFGPSLCYHALRLLVAHL